MTAERIEAYRLAFVEILELLDRAGLHSDSHGASAGRRVFARSNAEWRDAARSWLAAPTEHQGAMMTSLLVDGRPIHGDPGLTEVNRVFADLRAHPGTMRLLLTESLAKRAKQRSIRDLLAGRGDTFDIKHHALLPIVNIGRWAALTVGSGLLPTVERLRAASGSAMLPDRQAGILVEVFEVLQRLRLDWQLGQVRNDEAPTDILSMAELSPLDRSVIAEAVREIAAVQRRMDNIAQFVPADRMVRRRPPGRDDLAVRPRRPPGRGDRRRRRACRTSSRPNCAGWARTPTVGCRPIWPSSRSAISSTAARLRSGSSAWSTADLGEQPGHWVQLAGNHEAQYLAEPLFEWPERISPDGRGDRPPLVVGRVDAGRGRGVGRSRGLRDHPRRSDRRLLA